MTTRVLHARLTRAAAKQVRRGHPWVFDQSITRLSVEGEAGDLVVLHDDKRAQIGLGLYDPAAHIRVRVLHQGGPVAVDDAFFDAAIARALELRAGLEEEGTTGYRVVHGENDGLGGVVVDRYAGTLVIKVYSAAWLPRLEQLLAPLRRRLSPARIVLRLARKLDAAHEDGAVLWGAPVDGRVEFLENGLRFEADVVRGQKTGFFLDQRENRAAVEARSAGREVLNVFSYSGGFSLYAARGGARSVVSLDQDRHALAAAERHFALNAAAVAGCAHRALEGDAFEELRALGARGARFDLVIIDPPSFAKRRAEVEGALRSYARLVELGLGVLREDGQLVLASCSSRVDAGAFRAQAERAAAAAGRPLTVEEETGHARDHPVGFPEGAYLKCLFCRAAP